MENVKCIFCNIESNEIVIRENGYVGIKCPTCNLIYTSPKPKLNEIIDLYGHDNANISAKSHIKDSFVKTLYAKHNLKIINRYSNGKILEIGAGAGYFLNEARKQGFDVYGVEFNKTQATFIKEKLKIACEQLPLNDKTFNNNKFDLIYHCDVISHFYDPIAEFEKAKFKLKKNGFVIFETGNLGDVNYKYYKYWNKFQYPDHLFFFSEKNIKILLEQTGFELIKIYRYSILPQLLILDTLRRLFSYIKPSKSAENYPTININQVISGKENNFKKLLKNIYSYIFYLIRYKVGLIMPKKGRPQTIIIIGKKNSIAANKDRLSSKKC